jgi:hypothetical protein
LVDTGSRIDPHPLRPASEGTHFKYLFLDQVLAYLDAHDHRLLAQELGIAPFCYIFGGKSSDRKGESGFPGNGVRSLSEDAKRIIEPEKRPGEAETERHILNMGLCVENCFYFGTGFLLYFLSDSRQ